MLCIIYLYIILFKPYISLLDVSLGLGSLITMIKISSNVLGAETALFFTN